MFEFQIYSGSTLVGTSKLEGGDPPMGVAFGRFVPATGYATIRAECISSHRDQTHLNLSVRTPTGEVVTCCDVAVLEVNEEVEVNVLGISHPEYAVLFPHHVAHYDQTFK